MLARPENQRGFTLIEAIVAAALFAVTVSSIVGVYLSTLKVNRRTDVIRSAAENARYLTEYMTKEIRNGQIDYFGPAISPCTTNQVSPSNSLEIINTDGDKICFYLGDNSGLLSASGKNLWMAKNNLQAVKLNSSNVYVNNLNFYVSPTFNPYNSGSTIQPRVTIVGSVQAVSGSQDQSTMYNNITIPIETSISLPAYDIAP